MDDEQINAWKSRIHVVHVKMGRTLRTAILHVEGTDDPPFEALILAANEWRGVAPGQVARRPDEAGKQVYWVNVAPLI